MLDALGMPRGLYNALMPALVLLVSWNGTLSMLQRRVVQTPCEAQGGEQKVQRAGTAIRACSQETTKTVTTIRQPRVHGTASSESYDRILESAD